MYYIYWVLNIHIYWVRVRVRVVPTIGIFATSLTMSDPMCEAQYTPHTHGNFAITIAAAATQSAPPS